MFIEPWHDYGTDVGQDKRQRTKAGAGAGAI